MTNRLIPDYDTGIHLYVDEEGTLQVDVLLPTDITEDSVDDVELPVHTQLALDLMQALANIIEDVRAARAEEADHNE